MAAVRKNWKRIEKLMEHLRTLPPKRFSMGTFINNLTHEKQKLPTWDQPDETVERVLKNGPACETACCLAGDACVLFAPKKAKISFNYQSVDGVAMEHAAQKFLGLTDDEAWHMFYGGWHRKYQASENNHELPLEERMSLSDIPKRDAVKYLKKVLAQRNIMVTV